MDVLTHKIKWEVSDRIAFKESNQKGEEEIYLIAKRKREKCRVQVGTLRISGFGSYSIKEILIGFGFRRVGIVGISKQHPTEIRVKCPHCQMIQKLKEEWQECSKCGKKFYLFDDNW